MKDSIENQVAQLTEEQKRNMGKIYKKYTISLCSIFVITVITAVFAYFYFGAQAEKAADRYEAMKTQNELQQMQAEMTGSFYVPPANTSTLVAYYDLLQDQGISIMVIGIIGLICEFAVYLIFKKKYPYFSEKKYKYLKKQNK